MKFTLGKVVGSFVRCQLSKQAILNVNKGYATVNPSVIDATTNRPQFKSSAFTGKADFYEALFFFQDVLKKAQSVDTPSETIIPIPWHPLEAMAEKMGFALTKLQYRKIRTSLNELALYSHISEIRLLLDTFSQTSIDELLNKEGGEKRELLAKLSNREPDLGFVDTLGRAVSVGRRKSASAKIYMVPGTGECFVNGVPAIEYFKRPHELFRLADPFDASTSFGKFNAWCLVRGGGYSGQANAIVQGLAKAMTLLSPDLRGSLRPFLYRDRRVVERKKSGQPKARKKFTWVKR